MFAQFTAFLPIFKNSHYIKIQVTYGFTLSFPMIVDERIDCKLPSYLWRNTVFEKTFKFIALITLN